MPMNATVRGTLLAVSVAAALFGCGTMSNRLAPEKLSPSSLSESAGVILISTGAPKPCVSNGTFLRVLRASQQPTATELLNVTVDGYATKSDFADHHGHINAIPLPTGDYYFAPFTLRGFGGQHFPRFDFTVRGNELTYLGEVFAIASCSVLNPTLLEVRDQEERDAGIFRERNPVLESHPVTKRLLRSSGDVRG